MSKEKLIEAMADSLAINETTPFYVCQAKRLLFAIEEAGFRVVPRELSEELVGFIDRLEATLDVLDGDPEFDTVHMIEERRELLAKHKED